MNRELLKGRSAIVTGGARGIGRAIALELAARGANILFTWRSGEAKAKETEGLLEGMGAKAISFCGDVSDPKSCDAAAAAAVSGFGGLDILVNNAGINLDKLLLRLTPEEFDSVVRTNLNGSFHMLKAAAKILIKNGGRGGRIVNISSVVGLRGNPGQINYAASKAGIIGMTLSAAKELGSRGVTVNAVAPGFIETDMTAGLSDALKEKSLASISLGRAGQPEDVANLVAFLASDEAAYITGQVIAVDGGMAI